MIDVPSPVMALVTGIAEYHVSVLTGVLRTLRDPGLPLLVVVNEPFGAKATSSFGHDLIARGVPRGVIALADTSAQRTRELPDVLARAGLPAVTLGTKMAGYPLVHGDNVAGMRELMAHLLDQRGVRHPALLLGLRHQVDSTVREQVFRAELARRGIPVDEDLVLPGEFRADASYEVLHRLLSRRRDFDAVVALNDPSAFGALSALTDHGLRVPEDVLLAGFDNTEGSTVSWPALTTVDQNLEEQGRIAAEVLLASHPGRPEGGDTTVPSRLVVRTSTTAVTAPPEQIATTARAQQARLSLQDSALMLKGAMANCGTLDDVIAALVPCLARFGIDRCFIGITQGAALSRDGAGSHPTELALCYRNGQVERPPAAVFPRHELLPPALREELAEGVLLLQPLSFAGRERGYLLFEPPLTSPVLADTLRIDLPRTIDLVLSAQEMQMYAAMLEDANAELRRSVMRDGLTGIANRTAFRAHLDALCQDGGRRVAVLMIDVDMFKAYNDHYGHLAGDEALKRVAACLDRAVTGTDALACRYGGEEFAVVVPDVDAAGAAAVAAAIHRGLADAAIPHERSGVTPVISASIGVAAVEPTRGLDPTEVIEAADQALYDAKLQGRNRTAVARDRRVPQARRWTTGRRALHG